MAAKHFYRQGFLLLLFNFISTAAALEKRFSDFKRCADEECSMLLCRGKAIKDFSGPDCRFLTVKKSETIYVYYKLSGRRTDMWAGSVGSHFGYFPNDVLAVNHVYTEKEIEVNAEETDFVCFDTGFDKFDNYDIDSLLGSSLKENYGENTGTYDQIQVSEDSQKETQPSAEEATDSEEQIEHHDNNSEDLHEVPDDPSASLPELDVATESPSRKDVASDAAATLDATKRAAADAVESVHESVSERIETKDTPAKSEEESASKDVPENEPVSISEGAQIPKLETTLGTTFDAVVTTEDEITKNVTPYEEEESEHVENHPVEDIDVKAETPLLTFSEDTVNTPASDENPQAAPDVKPEAAEEKNMWTSLGDAVFSVVTGGERTAQDLSSEEDDDDEDVEEAASKTPQEVKNAVEEEPLSVESSKEPENIEPALVDDGEVVGPEGAFEETLKPTDEPVHHQTEARTISVDPVSQDDTSAQNSDIKTTDEPIEHKEEEEEEEDEEDEEGWVSEDLEDNNDSSVATEQSEDLDNELDENKTATDQELAGIETHEDPFTEEIQSDVKDDEKTVDDSPPYQINDHLVTDLDINNSQPELSVEEPEIHEEHLTEEGKEEEEEQKEEEKEGLLEDENALSFSQSDSTESDEPSPETAPPAASPPEPEYSDSVLRLTLLRDHFTAEKMEQVQKLLGLGNLFKVEAMFSDLDIELQATRRSQTSTTQDIETALEGILEASENTILDEIEKLLDSQSTKHDDEQHTDTSSLDEETEILDDFQELAFSLRQKYSTASDSTPLATEKASDIDKGRKLIVTDVTPHIVEEDNSVPEAESDDNLTVTDHEETPAETKEELVVLDEVVLDEVPSGPDVSVEEDGGHFNKNKDNQPSFSASDEMQKLPQATLETPLDMGLGVEVEPSPSGSLDSMEPVPEIHEEEEEKEKEEEVGLFSTGIVYMGCILSMIKSKIAEWTIEVISLLPEEWKPGETLFGCPWQAVVITALIGVVTFALFFWRTVLAVKKKEYLVDEKKLTEQILALKKEKTDAVAKMSELQKQTERLKENQKQSKETVSSTKKRMQDLESKVLAAETRNEHMAEEKKKYSKLLEDERANSQQNGSRIEKLEKSNEKLQLSRKKVQEALAKTAVLLDEAKIREDARNVQHKCLQKDYSALKEENKTLKSTIKSWEDKHKELNEQIKVYQKSQKELEDSVVLKDHNVEVLSELLADLDACDLQKASFSDKKTSIKNRIKQMMDVSRVQTTLTVVEEERDRFMTKLLSEEKTRKSLEEQHQELEHAIGTLKNEKSHVENQFKILQQKNEIMVEMYQQKENALQQRLTKEELERRSKESQLSEVGGKAVEAEGQVKVLRQRINEMEEQMKKTEGVYKDQIKEQENKTHSNWVNARNAERALNQEKLETSKLREKLAVLTSQLNERRAPLFRPNSGQPPGPRQGDSYGPSPVSGGAPSPPIMIEGPRRPPSAPVGRRIDPYGPRPPSDPHGRYAENKHMSGMDMMGPRSSSPANMDASTQAVDPQIKAETQAEASTDSPEPAPGSFLVSPIRDSPGPMVQGPPLGPGPGPHDQLPPPGPHGRLPPPGPYRPPRPGLYHLPPGPHGPHPPNVPPHLHGPPLPANGHPGMPLPGPMGGEFGPRPANGHAFLPRPGPGHGMDPRGPLPPHFRPPPPHHFGPMPLPHGVRGPMGPRPPVPHDMRYPGPRDRPSPPMNLPPGVPPHPAHGDAYGQAPPDALHNSHPGPRQDLHGKQEGPQDSARPAMVKP
ncbi:transport and Golgi organization protein 1 homolog isoform X2 [Sebastes umbrosus]|uniref:transport and Golgi organization protein 1 homolog isoform X2 n=1 Tax=Sebastes umbrosus TaxID=72105 RepID=UPI00189CE0FE|nr:transport and Golgi organization protein 1 homolog isoform X2 [Sebastes umbrosus]